MTADTFWDDLTPEQTRYLEVAVMVAPTLKICQAILQDEHVPLEQLDQDAVRRYGLHP